MLPHLYKIVSLRELLRSLSENPTKPNISSAKILFVEDQVSAKKLLLKILFGLFDQNKEEQPLWENTNVTWVTEGHAAIAAFNALGHTHFDFVLLDNQLNDETRGLDVALHIRGSGYTGPIIMVTSSDPLALCDNLNLQYASVDDTGSYELAPMKTAPAQYTEPRYPAYFSAKPISKESLSCILKQDFTFPDDSPSTAKASIPNPVWTRLNNAIAISKNKETDILDEIACLLQLQRLQEFLRTNFSDFLTEHIHIAIDHGHIPKEGAIRHILSSTLSTLLSIVPDTLDTAETELDHPWINQTYSIIKELLRSIDIDKHAKLPSGLNNQYAGF